ncbi:MAG: SDR family NAD(P)-dependent oxidoreductase, partial [Sphingomonadales bacterium]
WVSNAGVAIYAKLMDTPLEMHERMFRTNYFGTVHSAQAAVPHLRGGGALIVIGSIASDIPSPIMSAYAATKHAVKAYVGALRTELGADELPISITLVKPSGIDTPIGQHAYNSAPGEAQIPPPVYDPKLVAEAILDSAVRPRREITVGGVGRAETLFAEHFPRVLEWLAPREAAALTNPEKPQPKPSNLFEPVRGGRERSGEHPAARQTSVYTSAHLHPKTTAAIALAGLAVGAAAWAAHRPSRTERLRRRWLKDAND